MNLQDYFQSYDNYFWEWDNQILTAESVFESLSITDGKTIAYEQYAIEILDYLSGESIPPFGALLLAIIATNPDPKLSLDNIFSQIETTFKSSQETSFEWLKTPREFLDTLSSVPRQYKQEGKRKQLFQAIFSGCHNRISSENAAIILKEYRDHKHHLLRCAEKLPASFANFQKDFRTLSLLNSKFPDVQTLISKIGDLPEMPELDDDVAQNTQSPQKPDFIRELSEDPRTFPVGSLIKRVWSGLNIPLHHFESGTQPLGGVSDLTNKGDFHKLLISEFANDDDVFMSRLANNEALYIEREVPPEADKFTRIILLDMSLNSWGTPKILAHAAALAIATHPKTDIECRIFVIGESYKEVLYNTLDGVIDGLDILSPKLDASQGLRAFMETHTIGGNPEIFIISPDRAMRRPAMQKVLSDYYDVITYIIEPDFAGNINFFRIRNRSRKFVQHIYLPLEELWKNKPKEKNSKSRHIQPVYNNIPDYPILYPLSRNTIARLFFDNEIYLLTSRRSLYRTRIIKPNEGTNDTSATQYRGAELLLENLSVKSGGIHALGTEGDHFILISFYNQERIISFLNLNTSEYVKIRFEVKPHNSYKIFNQLVDGKQEFYLFNPVLKEYYSIKKSGDKLIAEDVAPGSIEAYNAFVENQVTLSQYQPGSSVLQSYMPVSIDNENRLLLNRHQLRVNTNQHNNQYSITINVQKATKAVVSARYSKEMNKFIFPDGSEVIREKRGILTLVSSNPEIPQIYVPASINYSLGLAAGGYFTGNEYFYKKGPQNELHKMSVGDFDNKFLQPFIKTILDHGV